MALEHLPTGSIYTHTFHIANLRDYGCGKTLVTDWVDTVMAKYSVATTRAAGEPGVADLAAYADRPQRALRRAERRASTRSTTGRPTDHGDLAGRRQGATVSGATDHRLHHLRHRRHRAGDPGGSHVTLTVHACRTARGRKGDQ